jgi:cold shock CspA family protein
MKREIKTLIPDTVNPEKGYGFIASGDEKKDYYFNRFGLIGCKYSELSEEAAVEFDAIEKGEKRKAVKIRLLKKESTAAQKDSQTGSREVNFNNTIKILTDILYDSRYAFVIPAEAGIFEKHGFPLSRE